MVLLELFTSLGCSSCPPAETLAQQLMGEPEVHILSYHVDYWNHLGWKDPFSDSLWTLRQRWYASLLDGRGLYTPQWVIDGVHEFVGSDSKAIFGRLKKAVPGDDPNWKLVGNVLSFTVAETAEKVNLQIARLGDDRLVEVTAGENAGLKLLAQGWVKTLISKQVKKGRRKISLKPGNYVVFLQKMRSGNVTQSFDISI